MPCTRVTVRDSMEKDTLESGRAGKSAGRRTTGGQTTASEDGVSRCARAKRARKIIQSKRERASWMRAQRSVAGVVSEARRRLRLKIEKIGGDATCGGVDLVVASGATRACRGSARMSSSGKSDGATIRALAFEDSYDIGSILSSGLETETYERIDLVQEWTSEDFLEKIERFKPDVLLLDFYMPPHTGLMVLKKLNEAVREGRIERPKFVLGMSSEALCNQELSSEGADASFEKWKIASWEGWTT